ncbi:MAG: fused MFS/spermidine synthase [Candidatus Hydrogenedentes bacterium]|nr:fused MFS/spermidine synthase [Candidatus Hydrogenedentota bacterium]
MNSIEKPVSQSHTKQTGTVQFLTLLFFFFVSGACGLLYQVVWTRKLVLLFGTTSFAVSTVLTVFFLGLGLGSLLGGRWADRSRNPLLAYGIVEIIVGVWALAFILGIGTLETAVVGMLRSVASTREMGIAIRAVLSIAFLIVPTTLMGATLPLLARAVTQNPALRGWRIGMLYSINTFGAVAGCALAGFVLIESLGYTRATLVGVAGNIAVGLLALLLARKAQAPTLELNAEEPDRLAAASTTQERLALASVLLAFAVSGFCTLALEVMWTRMLTLVFIGTTYAYTTMLTSLLCGIAVGAVFAAGLADRSKHPVSLYGLVEMLAGAACLLSLILFAGMPQRYADLQSATRFDFQRMVQIYFTLSFMALFVPTFLFGMTFPLAVRAATSVPAKLGRHVGRLYSVNTFGGVLGALAGGYLLLPALGVHQGILLLGLILIAVGALLVLSCPRQKVTGKLGSLVLAACVSAALWFQLPADAGKALNQRYVPEKHTVLHYREGVEGTVVVTEPEDNEGESDRILWINGVQATQSIAKGVKMNRFQGVLPLLFDRDPKTVLFMCFGSGITAGTLSLSDFDRIDAVEISRDVLQAAPWFAADNFRVFESPKVNFIVDDGRNFLLTTENTYDVITFEPMPLAVTGVSTFYTREYYELCKAKLAPGGIVSQWIPLHSLDKDLVQSLMYTFNEVFPESCAWFLNADLFLIGSNQPLNVDLGRAQERLHTPKLWDGLTAAGLGDIPEILSCYFMDKSGVAKFSEGGIAMSDDRPWAEFVAPKLMFEQTVDASLKSLRPLYLPEMPSLSTAGLDPAKADELRNAVLRRRQARVHDLAGVELMYGGMIGGKQEEEFIKALTIDPGDLTAQYYLGDMASQRVDLFIRWEEFENAEAYLQQLLQVMPGDPDLLELQTTLQDAKAKSANPATP